MFAFSIAHIINLNVNHLYTLHVDYELSCEEQY